jgi:tetratricopeptide (TPR) repeat protein
MSYLRALLILVAGPPTLQECDPSINRQRYVTFLGAAFGIFVTVLNVAAQDNAATDLRKQALIEYRLGHYRQAELILNRVLEAAQQTNNEYELALIYSALGNTYQEEMRFQEAEQLYRKSISIFLRQPERSHALAITWRNLASALTAETDYPGALAALDRASKLVETKKLVDAKLNAETLNGRGIVYFHQGQLGKAKTYLARAAQIIPASVEPQDLSAEDILNNLARIYQSSGESRKAEQTYRHALELTEIRLGPSHPNLAPTLTNLGTLCMELKRYKEAESHFQRSLQILAQPETGTNEYRLMEALYGLGKTYMKENDQIRAEPMLRRAVDIAHRNQNQPFFIQGILQVLDDYEAVLRNLRNPEDADLVHAEAQRIRAAEAFTVRVRSK